MATSANVASSTPTVVVAGPTAVGKSALGLRIARDFGGEIVSADSRQVYRGLDIGTAKATAQDRSSVPHHLVDILRPDQDYGLVPFLDQAKGVMDDVSGRGRVPVVVGGSSQYVFALVEGWTPDRVPPDPALRAALELRAEEEGGRRLHMELAAVDPEAAARIDHRNTRRVIRALEVRAAAERAGETSHGEQAPTGLAHDAIAVCLTLPRTELYDRIDKRVDGMIAAGWVSEVERLLASGYGPDLPSMSSIGYQELAEHVAGRVSLEDAVLTIKHRSHRLARGQYVWLRRAKWLKCFGADPGGIRMAEEWVGERLGQRC